MSAAAGCGAGAAKSPAPRARSLAAAVVLCLLAAPARAGEPDDLAAALARLDRAELERHLDEEPARAARLLPSALALAYPGGDGDAPAAAAIDALVSEALARAVERARDPRPFVALAEPHQLRPLIVGVLRGALARAEAPGEDQGQVAWAPRLARLAGPELPAEVRLLALEGLGRAPPSRDGVRALLAAAAGPDRAAREAAGGALARLSGEQGLPAWRRWAEAVDPAGADEALDEVLAVVRGDGRARAARRDALVAALVARPADGLARLERGLRGLRGLRAQLAAEAGDGADGAAGDEGAELEALERVLEPVALAAQRAPDPGPYLERALHPGTDAWIVAGAVRGLAARAAAGAPDDDALLAGLETLVADPDPVVRREALRALPAVLPRLDGDWFRRCLAGLDDPIPAVRDAAWGALRRLTGHDATPSPAAWRRWWQREHGS